MIPPVRALVLLLPLVLALGVLAAVAWMPWVEGPYVTTPDAPRGSLPRALRGIDAAAGTPVAIAAGAAWLATLAAHLLARRGRARAARWGTVVALAAFLAAAAVAGAALEAGPGSLAAPRLGVLGGSRFAAGVFVALAAAAAGAVASGALLARTRAPRRP
jgi:hypothetical protein